MKVKGNGKKFIKKVQGFTNKFIKKKNYKKCL